jgi:hypothetical protein
MKSKKIIHSLKKSLIIKIFAPLIFPVIDILFRLSYGLKAHLLFLTSGMSKSSYNISKTGIKIIKNDDHFINFSKWLYSRIPENLLKEERDELLSKKEISSFSVDIIQKLDHKTKLEILKFALNDKNVEMASQYLKFIPRLASIMVLYNIPKDQDEAGSQKWHRDWFNYRGVNIFSCVTPVDEITGMYSAIGKNYIPRYKEIPVFDADALADPWDRDRVSQDLMNEFIDNESISNLKGPTGTTAIVDSGLVYHKGGYIKDGYRLMIEISYQFDYKPAVSRPQNIISYLDLDNNNELVNIVNTPIKKYMVDGFISPNNSKRPFFHWLERNLSYYATKP